MEYAKTVVTLCMSIIRDTKEGKDVIFIIILAIFVIVLASYVIRADTEERKRIKKSDRELNEFWNEVKYRRPKSKRRPKGQTGRKHPKKKRGKRNGID